MAYRFQFRQCDELTMQVCTNWSDYKLLATSVQLNFERNEYAYVYLKGTGLNNFDASEVRIDNNTIVYNPFFRGLYLVVLDRRTLECVEQRTFDTLDVPKHETFLGYQSAYYTNNYSVDAFGGFRKPESERQIDMVWNRTNIFKYANNMAETIARFDQTHFIIVVSNYAWESYFSEELGRTLENCGAFLIKEFLHLAAARFGDFTRVHDFASHEQLHKTKLYHPYAMIGIPGLAPGMAYEQLRSN